MRSNWADSPLLRVPSPWRTLLIATILIIGQSWILPGVQAKDTPTIKVSDFDNEPLNLNYFKDSDIVLFRDLKGHNVWRSDDAGATWSKPSALPEGKALTIIMHPFDSNRAYVLTAGIHHWRTHDQGKTWQSFLTDSSPSMFRSDLMMFNAAKPDHILFNGMNCDVIFCSDEVIYTTDGFTTDAKFLRGETEGCWWAKSSDLFTTGDADKDANRILCIVRGEYSLFKDDQRLLISDNFFKAESKSGEIQEFEPNLNGFSGVQGVINIAIVKKYLLVATTSKNTAEMALYVTDDTLNWHQAVFPTDHRIVQEAYTVLEGTNYSIQIDVMTTRPSNPMGVMLTSNSNGTYFTRNMEHTNRNVQGLVDFEKISGIQGIFLVNQVDNYEDVEKKFAAKKKIKTKITFDDGRTFEAIKAGDKEIHLHSVTEINNIGRVFSSPAPGLVMGNGNSGDHLTDYDKANLYVSDDAGRTWTKGPDGPHKYEFGDEGSVLLAVHNSQKTDVSEIKYSLNHGKKWHDVALPDKLKIRPELLTTTPDSSSLKFILTAQSGGDGGKYHIISIDFNGLHEDTCKESDMEEWYARVDDDGKPSCIMGHKQQYHRRKKEATCFIKQKFKAPIPKPEPCECTDADFECDFNFVRDGKECKLSGTIKAPDGACKNGEETFKASSGWRRIPGDDCKRKDGAQKDDEKEYKCSDASKPGSSEPPSGKISHKQTPIKGDFDAFEKHYLERGDSSSQDDETIIMRPYKTKVNTVGDILITSDHGKTWDTPSILKGESIWAIMPHPHFKDMVFFIDPNGKVFYTTDRGLHYDSFEAPNAPYSGKGAGLPLSFHPDKQDWLIWHGWKCPSGDDKNCYLEASWSTDRGDHWTTLKRYVKKCEFSGSKAYNRYLRPEDQILCLARAQENNDMNNPLQLMSTDGSAAKFGFSLNKKPLLEDVKDFATMAEFIVVATENQTEGTLHAMASLDGRNYADAHFPYNFAVPHQHAYTVLDSSTHAVNLFVVTETAEGARHGSIVKSNSNGTSYVMSIEGVNCDDSYYVDFEKMLGLQGVVLVNTLKDREARDGKTLQTKISHNDGAEWAFLPPPKQDVDGKSFSCSSSEGTVACALHIHGYTERVDHRQTFSSESAIGIMFGWGNVGNALGKLSDADTFMTTDAGISWTMAKKGVWTWSFGDQGSIIVLAQREKRTKSVSYTIDEGKTWQEYEFSDSEIVINDITTLRSGASRNFLLWGHKGDELFTINMDFSGLTDKVCNYDEKDPGKSDYALWSPKHPKQPDGCLFGHQTQFLRKKTDRTCYNSQKLQHIYNVQNCTCTREDFECDFNFEMDNVGACSLVPGLQPISADEYCKQVPDAREFWEPTGYRRIPLTTCVGGVEFDKTSTVQPCPGHEQEFDRAHGISGVGVFFAIVIPICVAGAVGWWVWRNFEGKFGQIRLGESGGFNNDAPWVKYPVIAISAVVAVVGALPLVAAAVWRSAAGLFSRFTGGGGGSGGSGGGGGGAYSWLGGGSNRRFTTRDSFARGRADYAIVDEDEGELLGDDSDEEV